MMPIQNLEYISRSGFRASVGHATDDPYLGKPKSDLGLLVMRDGPVGVTWTFDGRRVEKIFQARIQAALDKRSNTVVVIGHWGAPIEECHPPSNGLVLKADGSLIREVALPSYVSDAISGEHGFAESLTVVKSVSDGIEIWIAHDDGRWHERRIFDPVSGKWGSTVGQYRAI